MEGHRIGTIFLIRYTFPDIGDSLGPAPDAFQGQFLLGVTVRRLVPPGVAHGSWKNQYSVIGSPQDLVLALTALAAQVYWKLPPWLVVSGNGRAARGMGKGSDLLLQHNIFVLLAFHFESQCATAAVLIPGIEPFGAGVGGQAGKPQRIGPRTCCVPLRSRQ